MIEDENCYVEIETYMQLNQWTEDDVKFWTGNEWYQPWKDVALLFKEIET